MSRTAADHPVVYPSRPIDECLPDRMATIAALAGVKPPAFDRATVVDIGCATAANLLSIAAAYPGVRAIGVDPSSSAIAYGQALADDAGLSNVQLVADTRVPLDDGEADFVMAHGVLSWVDDETRAAVIAEAARVTRPGGLILFSFNASPGALKRFFTRSVGRRAARAEIEAGDAEGAHAAVLARLQAAAAYAETGVPQAEFAGEEAKRLAQHPPGVLFHDELHSEWVPLAVSALSAQTARVGVNYLGELRSIHRWRQRLPAEEVRTIVKLAGPSAAAQQQFVDDMLGTAFHTSLFLRGTPPREPIGGGERRPAGPPASEWHVAVDHAGEWPQQPSASRSAAADAIREAGPSGLSIGELAERAGVTPEAARQIASTFDAHDLARLSLAALPAAREPGKRPRVSPLAQAELRSGAERVSGLRHRGVLLHNPQVRALALLLDGTRDRAALVAALEASTDLDPTDTATLISDLDATLGMFADVGLLSP